MFDSFMVERDQQVPGGLQDLQAVRRISCTKPIMLMPESIAYDAEHSALLMGDGEFAPGSPSGGGLHHGRQKRLQSWFDYRKKDPVGRRPSPLDHLYPTVWDPDWTTEAIDLLTVLTRLVELEPAQADLLSRILAGDLLSLDDLLTGGTHWPVSQRDRKPRFT